MLSDIPPWCRDNDRLQHFQARAFCGAEKRLQATSGTAKGNEGVNNISPRFGELLKEGVSGE